MLTRETSSFAFKLNQLCFAFQEMHSVLHYENIIKFVAYQVDEMPF